MSVATKELIGENGVVKEFVASRVEWKDGKMAEDDKFRAKEDMQKIIDEANKKLEEISKKKEAEILNT